VDLSLLARLSVMAADGCEDVEELLEPAVVVLQLLVS
jgi:hypothetical protein